MKTKFLFALAFALTTVAFAQKKEVKAIEKAVKSGSYGQAKAAVGAAEALMGNMDEKTKEKFLLLKAQAYLGVNNTNAADLKVAAETFSMLKDSKYSEDAQNGLNTIISNTVNGAIADQNAENFKGAAQKLEQAYQMSKKDTIYLYYAASNAVNGQDYDTALKYYTQLKDMKFQGREQVLIATNVETGEVEEFGNAAEREIAVLGKTHIKPDTKLTDSKSAEIAKNIALIYISKEDNDKALQAMADARAENPDDILLLRSEADIYLKMNKMDKYKESIEEVLKLASEDEKPELFYNLGVSADQLGDKEQAMLYYKKSIELNPDYGSSYNNLAALILSGEQKIVDEMNSLGTSKADFKKYDELKVKRENIYRDAMPYLEKALAAKPQNIQVARSLYGIYQQLDMQSKADTIKSKIDALEGGE
ncbi:tetratricopeptide repeat protein [Dokdonia sinensis]|uniref:Tetratricopeptide repeat protein n=1 Tax=Dokdonia sinensis TaxID=2479847 RepID=A0A3M0GD85_9FLAO|nr:tetratricopeptide repeat protein [Dokdonia sinensis]RMB59533.1 tetratricopeptide repeat protein [Dokdonia sinensis]